MTRETGYYWVKFMSTWTIGYYVYNHPPAVSGWFLVVRTGEYQDSDFDKIDEKQLMHK